MKKNLKFIGIILLFVLLTGCGLKKEQLKEKQINKNIPNVEEDFFSNFNNCKDCGEAGWQLMNEKCNFKITSKNDAIKCLSGFEWSGIDVNFNYDEIKEGYIKVNGYGIEENGEGAIKIYNYKLWSIDQKGNLYLEGQLG